MPPFLFLLFLFLFPLDRNAPGGRKEAKKKVEKEERGRRESGISSSPLFYFPCFPFFLPGRKDGKRGGAPYSSSSSSCFSLSPILAPNPSSSSSFCGKQHDVAVLVVVVNCFWMTFCFWKLRVLRDLFKNYVKYICC